MKRWLAVSIAFCLTSSVLAQEPPKKEEPKAEAKKDDAASKEVLEILKKADTATKKVNAVKYVGSSKGTGVAASRVQACTGTATLSGKSEQFFKKARFEIKAGDPASADAKELVVGTDGENYYVLDAKKKTAYVDIDPSVLGSAQRYLGTFVLREYAHPTPFEDEINGKKQELKGTTKIGSEECYEIYVNYGEGRGEATWFFSKKDYLPRKVIRYITQGSEKGTTETEITELTVDPKITDDTFKLTVPDGYKKTDEPMP